MKTSELLRKASAFVRDADFVCFCCPQIDKVCLADEEYGSCHIDRERRAEKIKDRFAEYYKPSHVEIDEPWWLDTMDYQWVRAEALLHLADKYESEGD